MGPRRDRQRSSAAVGERIAGAIRKNKPDGIGKRVRLRPPARVDRLDFRVQTARPVLERGERCGCRRLQHILSFVVRRRGGRGAPALGAGLFAAAAFCA